MDLYSGEACYWKDVCACDFSGREGVILGGLFSEGANILKFKVSQNSTKINFFRFNCTTISQKSSIKVLKVDTVNSEIIKRNYHTKINVRFCLKISPKRVDASNVTSQHFRFIDIPCVK